jgi:hypothetical protein
MLARGIAAAGSPDLGRGPLGSGPPILVREPKPVAEAPNRLQASSKIAELLSQPANVYIDCSAAGARGRVPHRSEQLLSGERLPTLTDQG